MNINLFNKLDEDIEYAVSASIDPSSANFNFKRFSAGKPVKFNQDERYLALKVPPGKAFSFNPITRIMVNFMQVIPKSADHDDHDIYLFQVIKWDGKDELIQGGGGDGDIEPPIPGIPSIPED